MAQTNEFSAWRILRYIIIAIAAVVFFISFLIWRTDNPRIEALRFTIIDRYAPGMDWVYTPFRGASGLVGNFQSYEQLVRENRELRQQVQQMESWREAALQLEQINAELRALNNLSAPDQMNFVTGEVIADSGSPFSQTALINIGRNKGVESGAPAVDGFGLIGRVIGVGKDKSRVLLLSDPSSQISARVLPQGIRAIVRGNNGHDLDLTLIEGGSSNLAGSRVVTSGDGIYPGDLLIGYVTVADNKISVRIAADFSSLELARILLASQAPDVPTSTEVIGTPPEEPAPEAEENSEEGAEETNSEALEEANQ